MMKNLDITNCMGQFHSYEVILDGEMKVRFKYCVSQKMSHFSAEHGAITYEKAQGTAQKGLTAGLKGWWGWVGSKEGGVAGGQETFLISEEPRDPQ